MRVIDLNTLSVTAGSGIAETKIPLWWSDGTNSASNATSASSSALIPDGAAGIDTISSSRTHLFTLSSNWNPSLNFSLECTQYIGATPYTAYAELWDITSNSGVSASQTSTTSTTATIVRSGKFTLIPGHSYGVSYWGSGSSSYAIDASLIVFPQ